MYSCGDTLAGGLPHSDIHGSKPARGSPWLFAACHVLHRLLVPRHPPNALLALEISDPPCPGTIHTGSSPPRQATRSAHIIASERFRPVTGQGSHPIRSDLRPGASRDAPEPDSP